MKRLALIVSAIAMTATAHAQDATEFKNGGEFRARYENFFNKSGQESAAAEQHIDTRLKWNMNIRKGERLQAQVSLLHNARLGGATSVETLDQAQYVQATSNNSLTVSRAWGWWRGTDMVSFKVGRFGIEFADGAVFSENDWQALPVVHEGLDIAVDSSFATFHVYGLKQSESNAPHATAAGGNSDPESSLYMVTADLKNMPEAIKLANIHLLDMVSDQAAATTGRNLQHIGFTVGGDVVGFMYKATAAFQFGSFSKPAVGTEVKASGNMFDLMVGYGLPETMGLKLSAGYHMDSGDDTTTADKNEGYQTMYYDRHNYGGLMDVINWGNSTYFNVNASIMPAEDLEAGLGFYMFSKSKDNGGVNFGQGWNGTPTPAATSTALGSEIDVFANKAYGPDMKIGARYSMFMPGDSLKNAAIKTEKLAHGAYLQASIGF